MAASFLTYIAFLAFNATAYAQVAGEQDKWMLPVLYVSYDPYRVKGPCTDSQDNIIDSACFASKSGMDAVCTQIAAQDGYTVSRTGYRLWVELAGNPTLPNVGVCRLMDQYLGGDYPIHVGLIFPGGTKCLAAPKPMTPQGEIEATLISQCQYSCPSDMQKSGDYFCKPKTCPVQPLSKITDPVASQFEAQNGNAVASDQLSANAKTAWADLQAAFAKLGEAPKMTSAYRPTAYQAHLFEVTNKYREVNIPNFLKKYPQCATIKTTVDAEYKKHGLNGKIAKSGSSIHESGNAFDFVPQKMSLKDAYGMVNKLTPPAGYSYEPLEETNAIHVEIRKIK